MKANLLLMVCLAGVATYPNVAAAQQGSVQKEDFSKIVTKGSPQLAVAGVTLGYAFEYGAFDLTAGSERGLFILGNGKFPDPKNRFYNEPLHFYSQFTAVINGHSYDGELYKVTAGGDDRYFFFGKDDIQGAGRRWLIPYKADGTGLAWIANVAKK